MHVMKQEQIENDLEPFEQDLKCVLEVSGNAFILLWEHVCIMCEGSISLDMWEISVCKPLTAHCDANVWFQELRRCLEGLPCY